MCWTAGNSKATIMKNWMQVDLLFIRIPVGRHFRNYCSFCCYHSYSHEKAFSFFPIPSKWMSFGLWEKHMQTQGEHAMLTWKVSETVPGTSALAHYSWLRKYKRGKWNLGQLLPKHNVISLAAHCVSPLNMGSVPIPWWLLWNVNVLLFICQSLSCRTKWLLCEKFPELWNPASWYH